jgi:eukaryotic-like serine/threonine-protein kinase
MAIRAAKLTFETAFDIYQARSVIGEGGAGRVHEVTSSDGRILALKILHAHLSTTDKRKRFKNEIEFLSKDRHTNIIRVVDSGLHRDESGGALFYVMPRLPGTLRTAMDTRISPDRILPLFDQVLSALDAAHRLEVVHRDLKPQNILHDPAQNRLVVADFGVAHFEEENLLTAVETRDADRLANFLYAAPEQRVRGHRVDHRADIFALGLILNEMFTGQVPQGAGIQTIAAAAPQYAYLDPLVERMTQQDPSRRPASVEEIKKELLKRKNDFVVLQRLDESKRKVVPAYRPDEVAPVELVHVDWDGDVLTFTLNRAPERGWIDRFRQPRGGFSALLGKGPDQFHFAGGKAQIQTEEHQVQAIVSHFNTYLSQATSGYHRDLEEHAQRRQYEEREQLKREQELAERRARVLQNLKY